VLLIKLGISLIHISKRTQHKPEEIMKEAVEYFTKKVGLKLTDLSACCAYFEGGGGHVKVSLVTNNGANIEIESREWEYQAKEFLEKL